MIQTTTEPIENAWLAKYSLGVDKSSWKEEVRRDLSAAPISTTRIAEDLGLDKRGRDRLYGFLSRGTLNSDEVKRIDDYLRSKGFRNTPEPIITDESFADAEDPVDAIMVQLRALVAFCSNKKTFDYATRLAAYKEGIAGVDRHIMPVAEHWLEKLKAK
jgi:hypothetical protein